MSHALARQTIQKNKSRLSKHFSENPEWELDKETVRRLQKEIEQAEMHLEESEDDGVEDWHHGDNCC